MLVVGFEVASYELSAVDTEHQNAHAGDKCCIAGHVPTLFLKDTATSLASALVRTIRHIIFSLFSSLSFCRYDKDSSSRGWPISARADIITHSALGSGDGLERPRSPFAESKKMRRRKVIQKCWIFLRSTSMVLLHHTMSKSYCAGRWLYPTGADTLTLAFSFFNRSYRTSVV